MRKFLLIASVLGLFSLFGCNSKNTVAVYENGTDKFIESISPTFIGRASPISVSFVYEPKVGLDTNASIEKYLKLSPSVEGEWNIQNRMVTFNPKKSYKPDSKITLSVDCGKLFGESGKSEFYKHDFIVGIPKYSVSFDEIRLDDKSKSYTLTGRVITDIPVSEDEISATLKAKFAGKSKSVEWTQSDKGEIWNFSVDGIESDKNEKELSISWSGRKLGLTKSQDKYVSGSKNIKIPSSNAFSIIDVNTEKPNTILVSFSKKIDASQNISSFVRTMNDKGVKTDSFTSTVRGNVLTLFNDSDWANIRTVAFDDGIRSSDGMILSAAPSVQLSERWDTPDFNFTGDNIILPTTQGAVFPIETKNLSGILVQVYAIYERTIPQFLQENDINGTSELYRVGEPVWEKKISFDWNDSMQNKYISRGLDLSELVKKYPYGMFHIRLSFRKDQIKYICRNRHDDFSSLPMPPDTIEPYKVPNERSSWDYWESSSSRNRDGYWRYDGDPCHPAFYMPRYHSSVVDSRNILISDLGIMVKRDSNDNIYVSVADIKTAKAVPNATVEIHNYIGSVVDSGKTDANGNILFKDNKKTYVIVAKVGNQASYLKLSSGTSLSVSHFEIGGEKSENGVKGFIYGERGVWRPGDNIYLTFVLQDLKKTLPADIPVTFELKDPMGRSITKRILRNSLNGFYPIETKTPSDASTGLWIASVTIGGKTWTKNLSVETVVPNKLSVELESDKKYLVPAKNKFQLKGAWLHGAPTPDYKAMVSVSFSPALTSFDGYSEYTFSSPLTSIESSRETVWEGKLNSNSVADFTAELDAGRNLPGKLKANFVSRIDQPSGGFSTQSKSFEYSPYSSYVGIKLPKGDATRNMLLTDVDHTVDVVLLDADGKAAPNTSLSYTVYKLEWKWWWEKDAYTSATHVSSRYYSKVASGNVNVSNGKGSFKFQVKYPDWGRYIVEVKDGSYGHSAAKIVYIDWPGWAGRAQEGGSGSASMVPLVTGKKLYNVGETAEVTFTSNSAARALVTVEKAGSIIKQQWIDTVSGSNVYKLPITSQMSPNIYVHLTLIQPHLQTANSLPIRLYGVVPVMVDDPATKLDPVITMPTSFEPNKDATVSVSESKGRPMTYTLAVVDEGLLGLTNYHGPNLRSEFYKKEASRIESWDIYRYVMSAYSGKLETILSIGGAEEYIDDRARNENRFTPVVRYFGPFQLAAGEKKATTFKMPHYVGAVRAVVIAGSNGAYGIAEKSTPVKSDLMVQTSLPRTFGCNELVNVPVTLFNGDNVKKTVSVNIKVSGSVNFSSTEEVSVNPNGNEVVVFPMQTSSAGNIVVNVTAKTGDKTIRSLDIVEVKSRGIPVTYKTPFTLRPGQKSDISVANPGEKGTTVLTAELSTLPQIDLTSRLSYLTEYPHGCIEQITSGGFPQIFVPSYVKLSPKEIEKVKSNVLSVFDRYPTYQTVSGAFGYWPGNQQPHSWGTCYATHFMLEAKKKGYSVPESILKPALEWLKESASNWTSNSNDSTSIQAYRLYVLSLGGVYDTGSMNRLSSNSLSGDARLLLAAAYANSGRKNDAVDLLRGYKYSSENEYRSYDDSFSSGIREAAIYLNACVLANYLIDVPNVAKGIATTLSSNKWLSTQEAAWSLNALLPYYSQQSIASAAYEIKDSVQTKGERMTSVSVTEKLTPHKDTAVQTVTVSNTGTSVIYGSLIASGKSVPGSELKRNEGLELSVEGFSTKNLSDLKVGDNVKIKVKISNKSGKNLTNLALTIPVPTCFEFTNERVGDEYYSDSSYTYQDIRDNAIYTYFDLERGYTKTYTFNAVVAYSGSFYVPAIIVEAMYDNNIVAVQPGQLVRAK